MRFETQRGRRGRWAFWLTASALWTAAGCTDWYGNALVIEVDGGAADAAPILCDPTGLDSDPHRCGSCTNDCTLLPGINPAQVVCKAGSCRVDHACLPALVDCENSCVDEQTDVHHCGSCTNDCAALTGVDATKVACQAGACVASGACLPTYGDCDGDRVTAARPT